MDSPFEISDDDDSFTDPRCNISKNGNEDTILISTDEEPSTSRLSDSSFDDIGDDLPDIELGQKKKAVHNLFSKKTVHKVEEIKKPSVKVLFPPSEKKVEVQTITPPNVVSRWIGGVNVLFPVIPYGSQVALVSKIIQGIKESKNCILESPTGSGKTLALLCGVLAWQQSELNRVSQGTAKRETQNYFKQYPELQNDDVTDYVATPIKKTEVTPEKLFSKTNFGEKSIYDKSEPSCSSNKRPGPYAEVSSDEKEGLVNIHKKRRQGSLENVDVTNVSFNSPQVTPTKSIPNEEKVTPEHVSVPTIYYGARTHMQLQQVIKEFKRTSYCGKTKMTLLSSRDKSCIREFNKDQWKTKNDMCQDCIKSVSSKDSLKQKESGCVFYDKRHRIDHNLMPPAFDLEDLVRIGKEEMACPYFGARELAKAADIIFCPYNYLIDPSIRAGLQIDLQGAIILIDEAHNIESNCREAASLSITQIQIQNALKEMQNVAEYRFANQDVLSFIDELVITLRNWNDWFEHQVPLIQEQAVNGNSAVLEWETHVFIDTLNNHNIGYKEFKSFQGNTENFCKRLREDPRTLYGVSQATGTLLESIVYVFGYIYRNNCQHLDDFKPVLEMQVTGRTNYLSDNEGWRKSNYKKWVASESLTLHLHCLNPAIVMESLKVARCIMLASGTMTPMGNIHAELGTPFPYCVSPNHVISDDRVWIGVVQGDSEGSQEYTLKGTRHPLAPARLASLVLRVCELTPHGVLCFLTSYSLLERLRNEWMETGHWTRMEDMKHVFCEKRNSNDHEDMMKDYYECSSTKRGALLFAVYRGKVSEGMDFKDHQARAVICMGIPYPSPFEVSVKAKMQYNTKYRDRGLLTGKDWLRVQAYRALNQAVGRCVRHKGDWGGVVLADARYINSYYTEHLSNWVKRMLKSNHHTYESLESSLGEFMQRMKISDEEDEMIKS